MFKGYSLQLQSGNNPKMSTNREMDKPTTVHTGAAFCQGKACHSSICKKHNVLRRLLCFGLILRNTPGNAWECPGGYTPGLQHASVA